MNVALWLKRAARLAPDAPALLRGEQLIADYREFDRRASALARIFRDVYAINPGDHIALFMANSIEYLVVMYGAWIAGAAIVPINAKLHAREAAWIIANAQAKLIVSAGTELTALRNESKMTQLPLIDVESDDFARFYEADPLYQPVHRNLDDVAWLFYTSGTTGRPKGVMQTHGNIQAMALNYFVDVDQVQPDDCILYAAPMSHGAGCYNFMFTIRAARHVVPQSGGFDAAEIEQIAPRLRNVSMFSAPTMVRRMIAQTKLSGYRGEGIKTVVYGGGPMYVADICEAVDAFGPRFVQIYGQAESPMTITALSRACVVDRTHPRWRSRLGSVGVSQSCVTVMIADKNGDELQRGEIGEILVSGPTVMKGYWNNDEATRGAIRAGWLWTGDIGAMDEDGFVTLHDRSKDMIISGGSNIYPREVEEVLLTHPSVAQVSVIGKPDAEWGEIVVAFIVLEAGCAPVDAELDALCLANIARFKRPKAYIYLPDLPKNAYGKVLKTDLRKQLQASA